MQLYKQKEEQQVELIDRILESENIEAAIRAVERNQGAPGRTRVRRESTRCRWGC